jgi:hypothetical protein
VLENFEMGAYSRQDRSGIEKDIEADMGMFPLLPENRDPRVVLMDEVSLELIIKKGGYENGKEKFYCDLDRPGHPG